MGYADTILADTPFGYWKLNDASGNPVDSSGNGRSFNTNGTPTYGEPSLLGTDATRSIKLPAAGLYLSNFWSDFTATMTWEAWMSRADLSTLAYMAGTLDATRTPYIRIPASSASIEWNTDSSGTAVTWTNALNDLRVHHVVLTYVDSTKVSELFVDGVSFGQQTAAQNVASSSGTGYSCGVRSFGNQWGGWVAHHALYASVLTPRRILAHYKAGRAIRRPVRRQMRVR